MNRLHSGGYDDHIRELDEQRKEEIQKLRNHPKLSLFERLKKITTVHDKYKQLQKQAKYSNYINPKIIC